MISSALLDEYRLCTAAALLAEEANDIIECYSHPLADDSRSSSDSDDNSEVDVSDAGNIDEGPHGLHERYEGGGSAEHGRFQNLIVESADSHIDEDIRVSDSPSASPFTVVSELQDVPPRVGPAVFHLDDLHMEDLHISESTAGPSSHPGNKLPYRVSKTGRSDSFSAYSTEWEKEEEDQADDDSSDGEYIPSPSTRKGKGKEGAHLKLHRKVKTLTRRKALSPSFTALSPSPPLVSGPSVIPQESSDAIITRTRPRNKQVYLSSKVIAEALASDSSACPGCTYVAKKHRLQDLGRHMKTHLRSIWVCCGIPVQEAWKRGTCKGCKLYKYKGKMMVGGCMHVFSRKDALQRHLSRLSERGKPCLTEIEYLEKILRRKRTRVQA